MPRKRRDKWDGIHKPKDREGFIVEWNDWQGRRRRRTVKVGTLKQAKKAKDAEEAKVEEAIRLGRPLQSEETFETFADEFLKIQERRIAPTVRKGRISQAEYVRQKGIVEQHLKTARAFKGKKLASIRRSDVIAYIHSRTGEVSDGTLIKEINCLRRLFYTALGLEKIVTMPVFNLKDELPRETKRLRWLTNEELGKLLRACPVWLQPIAGLAVALGTRRGELLAVRLNDIDLDAGTISLRKTKNGLERPAYINGLAMQVLESMNVREMKRKNPRGLLFPEVTAAQVTVAFVRACAKAGVEDFSFHDLRHCFASHLRMSGRDLHDIQKLLGHSDPRMTDRYAHLSAEHLKAAAQGLDGALTLPPPQNDAS